MVSISVTTYQHANYIAQTLDSIISQNTDFPFEILLGEDCSDDDTRKICLDYAKRYPQLIRLILHDRTQVIRINGRATGRFNLMTNFQSARGNYIALCEGDDFWIDENKLQLQFEFLESHPEYSVCSTLGIEPTTEAKTQDVIKPKSGIGTLEHRWFLSGKTRILTATLFCRADCINNQLLDDVNILTGDWAFLLGATEKGRKCTVIPSITAVYRNHGSGSRSGIDDVKQANFGILTLERYLGCAPEDDRTVIRSRIDMWRHIIAYATCGSKWLFILKCMTSSKGRKYFVERRSSRIKKNGKMTATRLSPFQNRNRNTLAGQYRLNVTSCDRPEAGFQREVYPANYSAS